MDKKYLDAMSTHIAISQITDEFIFQEFNGEITFFDLSFLKILYFLGNGRIPMADFKQYQETLTNPKSKGAFDTWISKFIRKTKDKDLILVERDQVDKRKKIIVISKNGEKIIKKFIEFSKKEWDKNRLKQISETVNFNDLNRK